MKQILIRTRKTFFLIALAFLIVPSSLPAATPEEEAESYFEVGMSLNKQRQFDDAIIEFAQAVKLSINTHKYHRHLHQTYVVTRRGRQGISFYKGLVREHPKNAVVHYWLGRFYMASRQLEAAAREAKKASTFAPDDERTYILSGHILARLNRNKEALEAYLKADELVPDVAIVNLGIGNLYFASGEHDKAERAYKIALESDSALLEVRYNLGLIYEKRGDFGEAAAQWKMMIDSDPNESAARERLAQLYFRAGFYIDAVREYATLSLVRLDSPNIFFALGEAQFLLAAELQSQEDRNTLLKMTRESFERVLELQPDNKEAKKYLDRLKPVEAFNETNK